MDVVELSILAKLAKPEVVVELVLAAVVTEKGMVVNAANGEILLATDDDGALMSDLNTPKGSKEVVFPTEPLLSPNVHMYMEYK